MTDKSNDMNDKNSWYAWIAVAFVAGFIIGFLAHWLSVRSAPAPIANAPYMDDYASTTPMDEIQGDNGVAVGDQQAGSSVLIQEAVLKGGGWVAIQDDNNGVPGRTLGAALFHPGTSTGLTVPLLRNTVAGMSYFAVLHTNVGNNQFSPRTDAVLYDANGNPIMAEFTAEAADSSTSTINLLNI